jgi:catechol 2,3-dioxygenase-like lactoylglutathione lyase family enzyme
MERIAEFSKMAPQLVVTDVVKTAEFYRDKLGFKILGYFLDPPVYAMLERDNVELHFGKADGDTMQTNEAVRKGLGSDVYIWTNDLEALHKELIANNLEIVEGPVKRVYGTTEITIRDCNGFTIVFGD